MRASQLLIESNGDAIAIDYSGDLLRFESRFAAAQVRDSWDNQHSQGRYSRNDRIAEPNCHSNRACGPNTRGRCEVLDADTFLDDEARAKKAYARYHLRCDPGLGSRVHRHRHEREKHRTDDNQGVRADAGILASGFALCAYGETESHCQKQVKGECNFGRADE